LVCKGVYACSGIDPALLDVERHDLDPAPRLKVFEAEKATRVGERSSVEQHAATCVLSPGRIHFLNIFRFLNVCRSRCPAVDSNGKACTGQPKMKEKAKVSYSGLKQRVIHVVLYQVHSGSRAQSYFVACDGWRKDFKTGHQTHTIPDNVNDEILAKLMAGHPLEAGSDTNLCSLIVSSHIGLKQALCHESPFDSAIFFLILLILAHPHIQGGRSDNRLAIVNHPCFARRTIYIPVDSSLRVALVVHKHVPHNHPMPRIDKASFETKVTYRKCVEAAGTLGATVQKVDRGQFNLWCS
jgi:hypothetical protein